MIRSLPSMTTTVSSEWEMGRKYGYKPTDWSSRALVKLLHLSNNATCCRVSVFTGPPHGPPPCALPCDPASLPGIDHLALHTFSGSAATASSVLLASVVVSSGLASLAGATPAQVRGHAAVYANALTWTLAASQWLKVLAHRSRPVLYTAEAAAAASDRENRRSFPSSHAALAFSAAAAYVAMAGRERLPHRTRNAVLLYAASLGVAMLRVSAGQHFPTDVAGGAALGTGIGWLAARG